MFAGFAGIELERALSRAWDKEMAAHAAQARSSLNNQHLTLPARWPYYEIKRARALRFARRIVLQVNASSSPRQRPPPRKDDPESGSEHWYTGFDGRLNGRADRTLVRDGELIIIDYKTGKIAEVGEFGADEIRPAYRRQLLLYAALHHDETGAWPAFGELVPLDGEAIQVEIDKDEAIALVEETLKLLDEYNSAVDAGAFPHSNPSPDNCTYCPFQGMCDAYWSNVQPAWARPRSASIAGIVAGIHGQAGSANTIQIETQSGNQPQGQYELRQLTAQRFIDLDHITVGVHIRAVRANTEGDRASSVLVPTEITELWWHNDGSAQWTDSTRST
jgi:RecB family exonuclease